MDSLIQGKFSFLLCASCFCMCFLLIVFLSQCLLLQLQGGKLQLKFLGVFHFVCFCFGRSLFCVLCSRCSCSMCSLLWALLILQAFALNALHSMFLLKAFYSIFCSRDSLLCVLVLSIFHFVFLFCELLQKVLFNLCFYFQCSCFGHSLLCVLLLWVLLALGIPCCVLLFQVFLILCALALDVFRFLCSCFGHSLFCVFFVVLKVAGGSC